MIDRRKPSASIAKYRFPPVRAASDLRAAVGFPRVRLPFVLENSRKLPISGFPRRRRRIPCRLLSFAIIMLPFVTISAPPSARAVRRACFILFPCRRVPREISRDRPRNRAAIELLQVPIAPTLRRPFAHLQLHKNTPLYTTLYKGVYFCIAVAQVYAFRRSERWQEIIISSRSVQLWYCNFPPRRRLSCFVLSPRPAPPSANPNTAPIR